MTALTDSGALGPLGERDPYRGDAKAKEKKEEKKKKEKTIFPLSLVLS